MSSVLRSEGPKGSRVKPPGYDVATQELCDIIVALMTTEHKLILKGRPQVYDFRSPPDTWINGQNTKFRCPEGHVITGEEVGQGPVVCPSCNAASQLFVTFPEDRSGPIGHVLGMP